MTKILTKERINFLVKPSYFKKQCFSSSFLLAWDKCTGQQATSMHLGNCSSLLNTPWPFLTFIFTSGIVNNSKVVNNLALVVSRIKTCLKILIINILYFHLLSFTWSKDSSTVTIINEDQKLHHHNNFFCLTYVVISYVGSV